MAIYYREKHCVLEFLKVSFEFQIELLTVPGLLFKILDPWIQAKTNKYLEKNILNKLGLC